MKLSMLLFALLCVTSTGFARGLSPIRHSYESYSDARARSYFFKNLLLTKSRSPEEIFKVVTSPEDLKKPLRKIDISSIVDIGSYSEIEKQFKYIRDTRFLETQNPTFPRRITWLYPDDGCYARAEFAKLELDTNNFPAPQKVFAFGDLYAETGNSPSGFVEWWYHVAIGYRVGKNFYVFDPSVDAIRPLKIQEWSDRIGGAKTNIEFSICAADTFDPSADCENPSLADIDKTESIQRSFLDIEWGRILDLNRSPDNELGNNPPWL